MCKFCCKVVLQVVSVLYIIPCKWKLLPVVVSVASCFCKCGKLLPVSQLLPIAVSIARCFGVVLCMRCTETEYVFSDSLNSILLAT